MKIIINALILTTLIISTNALSCRLLNLSDSAISGPYTIAQSEKMEMITIREDNIKVPFGYANKQWNRIKSKFKDGDEFYRSDSITGESWVLVRNGCIVDYVVLRIDNVSFTPPSTPPVNRSTYAYKSGNLLMNNSPYSAYKYESKNLFKIVQHQNSHTEHEKVDGIVETYYETGELLEKLKFDKGRLVEISAYEKNGDQSLYFKVPGEEEYTFQRPGNGSDFKITPCKYGANVSWYEIWYENGNLAKSVPYSRGVVHGIIGTYYKTGELFEKWEFDYGKPVAMIVYKKDGTRMMKYGDSSELHSRNDYASTWCPSLRFDYTNLTIKTLSDSINTLSVVSNSDLIASDLPVGVTKCEPPTCVPGEFTFFCGVTGSVPVTYSSISDLSDVIVTDIK